MHKVAPHSGRRLALCLGYYLLLTLLAAAFFNLALAKLSWRPHMWFVATICGPASALFTHMSYLLYAFCSVVLLPWLVYGAINPRRQQLVVIGFVVCWFRIRARRCELGRPDPLRSHSLWAQTHSRCARGSRRREGLD